MKKLYEVTVRETGSGWERNYHTTALGFDHAGQRVKTAMKRAGIHRPIISAVRLVRFYLP